MWFAAVVLWRLNPFSRVLPDPGDEVALDQPVVRARDSRHSTLSHVESGRVSPWADMRSEHWRALSVCLGAFVDEQEHPYC